MKVQERIPELGHTAELGSMTVNYHDAGEGDPVLLIHGSGPGVTAWANWRLTIASLRDEYRVIAPDMAGFGYTKTADDFSFSKKAWTSQLAQLLDLLEIESVALVGNSFGGAIALEFARLWPQRCTRLVLMGPVGLSFEITEGLDAVWGYTPSREAMARLLQFFVLDRDQISADLVKMRYAASIRTDVQDRFARLFPPPRQQWIDALALSATELARIGQETLVVHGREDQVIPFEASERLSAALPNAHLVPFEQCGHWVQIEHAGSFNSLLRAFLRGEA